MTTALSASTGFTKPSSSMTVSPSSAPSQTAPPASSLTRHPASGKAVVPTPTTTRFKCPGPSQSCPIVMCLTLILKLHLWFRCRYGQVSCLLFLNELGLSTVPTPTCCHICLQKEDFIKHSTSRVPKFRIQKGLV